MNKKKKELKKSIIHGFDQCIGLVSNVAAHKVYMYSMVTVTFTITDYYRGVLPARTRTSTACTATTPCTLYDMLYVAPHLPGYTW